MSADEIVMIIGAIIGGLILLYAAIKLRKDDLTEDFK